MDRQRPPQDTVQVCNQHTVIDEWDTRTCGLHNPVQHFLTVNHTCAAVDDQVVLLQIFRHFYTA